MSTAQASVFNTRANTSGISVGGKIAKNKGSEAGEVAYMPTGLNTGSIICCQVYYVAAGTDDTDAVNVAQLKTTQTHYYSVKSTETGADSNYGNDGATGNNAMAVGPKAKAGTATSIAMGSGANATTATASPNNHSGLIALGDGTKARHDQAIAVGKNSVASGDRSLAIGSTAQASGSSAISIGTSTKAKNTGSVAIGNKAKSKGIDDALD